MYHLSLIISLEICISKSISMQSGKCSSLTHFLNISDRNPLYVQKHLCQFLRDKLFSLLQHLSSGAQSLCLPQKSTSALSWCGSGECQPHSQVVCQDELDKALLFCSVVLSQSKWYQSQMQFLWPVFTSHSSARSHYQWPELGHVPYMVSLWHWISHGAKNLENVTVLSVLSGVWDHCHTMVLHPNKLVVKQKF